MCLCTRKSPAWWAKRKVVFPISERLSQADAPHWIWEGKTSVQWDTCCTHCRSHRQSGGWVLRGAGFGSMGAFSLCLLFSPSSFEWPESPLFRIIHETELPVFCVHIELGYTLSTFRPRGVHVGRESFVYGPIWQLCLSPVWWNEIQSAAQDGVIHSTCQLGVWSATLSSGVDFPMPRN